LIEDQAKQILNTIKQNDGFHNMKMVMWSNLKRKLSKGIFDPRKAEHLFGYLTNRVRKHLFMTQKIQIPEQAGTIANRMLLNEFILRNKGGNPLKQYTVTVRQFIQLPFRTVAEEIDRRFTVNASSAKGAENSVKAAGIKGQIISVVKGAGK